MNVTLKAVCFQRRHMNKAAGMWIKFCNQISVYMKGPCTALIPDLMKKKNIFNRKLDVRISDS